MWKAEEELKELNTSCDNLMDGDDECDGIIYFYVGYGAKVDRMVCSNINGYMIPTDSIINKIGGGYISKDIPKLFIFDNYAEIMSHNT